MTEEFDTNIAEPEEDTKPKHHPMWHVIFLNDDYTPMDWVVDELTARYGHNEETATIIMFDVHKKGEGVAGTYTRDIAETKASMTMHYAQEAGHPLATAIRPAT